MSRIGNKPIPVPKGVTVELNGSHMVVKGPKGTLEQSFRPEINIEQKDGQIVVTRPSEDNLHRSLHGLTRTLIANMVTGVSAGFTKVLVINGVGYRAVKDGENLRLSVGYSHPVDIPAPDGITKSDAYFIPKSDPEEAIGLRATLWIGAVGTCTGMFILLASPIRTLRELPALAPDGPPDEPPQSPGTERRWALSL